MRDERHKLILELILTQPVETQKQLIDLLQARGVQCAQATLSRDIRSLHLYKTSVPGGGTRYTVSQMDTDGENREKLTNIAQMCISTFDTVDNYLVIKTLPGMAKPVCSYLDVLEREDLIVGRVEGNNTVVVVARGPDQARALFGILEELIRDKD